MSEVRESEVVRGEGVRGSRIRCRSIFVQSFIRDVNYYQLEKKHEEVLFIPHYTALCPSYFL